MEIIKTHAKQSVTPILQDANSDDFETEVRDFQDEDHVESGNEFATAKANEWLTICRVCGNNSEHLIAIFDEEGIKRNIACKINKYLPIYVAETDTLPSKLCYNCLQILLSWHELVEKCLTVESHFLKLQATETHKIFTQHESTSDCSTSIELQNSTKLPSDPTNELSTQYFDSPLTEGKEIQTKELINSTNDSTDSINSASEVPYTVEDKAEDSNPSMECHACKNCNRTFRREVNLKRHVTSCRGANISESEDEGTEFESQNPSMYDKESTLEDVVEESESDKKENCENFVKNQRRKATYPCMYCDFIAKKKKYLNLHNKEYHSEYMSEKKVRKPRSIDKESIKAAKMEVDGKVYYHCKECGKNLYSPYTFSWHIRIHTGERSFTCHLCGKQFRVNQGLARHLRETHAGIKNFPCDICGRMFSTKRNAEDHRRIHTGERPYVCNICGKTFKQKASLFVHNRTHTDVFPFKCNYCQQGFRTRPPLMVHITKHTGEKPHACDICGRCFRIKYELKRHRLIHFDDKPWQCCDCGVSFRQKRYLINHKKLNHPTNSSPTSVQ